MEKRAIIYCRVSTDDQRDNYSIPTQLAECVRYAEHKGYTVVGDQYVDPVTGRDVTDPEGAIVAYVDDYSSLEISRPSLDAAYDYLERVGYDVVIAYSLDRMDRDPYKLRLHEFGFAKQGATVEYVRGEYDNSPEGQFLKNVVSAAAKLDNDWRIERFNRGKRGKAKRGLFVAGTPPFGYKLDPKEPGGLRVVEEEAAAVRWIFNLYVTEGLSIYQIITRLDEAGIKPRRGGKWKKSSIAHILVNSSYIGKTFYNKNKRNGKRLELRDRSEWIEFSVTPIIEENIFEEAQSRLEFNRECRRRQAVRFYLLTGMVLCENCGRVYLSQSDHRHGKTKISYRHRTGKYGTGCMNREVNGELLEKIAWDKVTALLLDPSSLEEGYAQALQKERAAKSHQIELRTQLYEAIKKNELRKQNLTAAYTDPEIKLSKSEFIAQRSQIDKELKEIGAQLKDLEQALEGLPDPDEYKNLARFSEEIKARISGDDWNPTPENKRKILELLHVKIWLTPEGTGRVVGWFGNEYGFTYNSY